MVAGLRHPQKPPKLNAPVREFNYSSEYFDHLSGGWTERSMPKIAPLVRRVTAQQRPRRVLDYGCGSGAYAALLAEHGGEVEGCDVSAHVRAACEQRYARFQQIASSTELPDGRYDLLFSTEVLEHIEDHNQALRDFFRTLQPGGMVLLTTTTYTPSVFTMYYGVGLDKRPRKDALRGFAEWLVGLTSVARGDAFVRKWCFRWLGGHFHGFRPRALVKDFRRAGFEVVDSGVLYILEPLQLYFLQTHTLGGLARRADWPLWKRCLGVPLYAVLKPLNALLKRLRLFANNTYVIARKPGPRASA